MKLYVKKLCSLNPTRYEFITFNNAIKLYKRYVHDVVGSVYETIYFKSFDEWLKTEI